MLSWIDSGARLFTLRRCFGLAAVILLAASQASCGLTAPRSSEGFADLDSLGALDTEKVMTLSIGPTLLHFAANHADDEPETQALLRSLDGVRIRIYEIDGDASRLAVRMDNMSRKLQQNGWAAVMTVREDEEQIHMLIRATDDRIHGMTVLVSDGQSEAVVVNLMGSIQPQQFSEVMVALDVNNAGVEDVQPES